MGNGLGTLTANVTAFFQGGSCTVPAVGMGATYISWTDTHAYTITRISESGKTFWMKQDKASRVDKNGMSECQDYEYEFQPDAQEERVRYTKNHGWMCGGNLVKVGYREEYYDYSF